MFSVGQDVRVLIADNGSSCRGTVMVKNGDGSYEMLLSVGGQEEEIVTTEDRLAPLYAFETEPSMPLERQYAETWKNNGNVLFTAKDFSAAMGYYKKALACLSDRGSGLSFAMGEEVIVSYPNSINYKSGMVSDTDSDARTADVMLEDDENDEEAEECGVSFDRLLPLAKEAAQQLLQRSIYLNMARCALKLELRGWAIKYSSIAICITHAYVSTARQQGLPSSSKEEQNKLLADCYYFRAKALLAACRPKFATQDCRCLQQYDATKASALQREIQAHKEKTARSNRKLARDIASWVDTAMSASSKPGAGGGGRSAAAAGSGEDGDVGVLDEGEGEEGDDAEQEAAATAKRSAGVKDTAAASLRNLGRSTEAGPASEYAGKAAAPALPLVPAVFVVVLGLLAFYFFGRH